AHHNAKPVPGRVLRNILNKRALSGEFLYIDVSSVFSFQDLKSRMMLEPVQIRRRGAQDFEGYYDHVCAAQGSAPVRAVKASLSRGMLEFNPDHISLADWMPILSALAINKHLQHVAVKSCHLTSTAAHSSYRSHKKKIPVIHSKNMTFQLCKAVQKCLCESSSLKTLQLQGLPLRERDLTVLTKGLAKSVSLEHLSLAHCPIADQGLEDNNVVKAVLKKVLFNTKSHDSQYLWLKPPSPKSALDQSRQLRRKNAGKATYRISSRRSSSVNSVWRPPRPGSVGYVPWRTAARAGLQRGASQADGLTDQSFQNASSVRVTMETESESEEVDAADVPSPQEKITSYQFRRVQRENNRLQVELEECRLRLTEERNNRLKTNSRLVELELENERLRSLNQSLSEAHLSASVLEDEHVLESIESSFQKFHAFLDLLKDAGLGQFASMAGIDQSDFGLLGHPQLSSTERTRTHADQESQRNEERRESLAMADIPRAESGTHSEPPANTEDIPRTHSQQEVPLSPVSLSCASPPPLQEPLEFEAPERSRESPDPSNHQWSGGGSLSVSLQSSRRNGSSRVCSALNSRASSLSQSGSGRQSASGGQRGAAGLIGF
ncbi:hypothetical protein cypCar_00006385, partial [Cyprinus carpio]